MAEPAQPLDINTLHNVHVVEELIKLTFLALNSNSTWQLTDCKCFGLDKEKEILWNFLSFLHYNNNTMQFDRDHRLSRATCQLISYITKFSTRHKL